MNIEDSDRKGDILSDIEAELNEHIINEWKRIKKSSKSLADDSDKLTLSLIYVDGKFQFKVRDKSNNEKQRTFNISERSKGFQWFFNYMIKLKFNPNYTKEKENSIFLLDEPGSYLHSAAQKELLNELKTIEQDIREISHDLNREKLVLINNFVSIVHNLLEEQKSLHEAEVTYNIDTSINWDKVGNAIKICFYRVDIDHIGDNRVG